MHEIREGNSQQIYKWLSKWDYTAFLKFSSLVTLRTLDGKLSQALTPFSLKEP